MGTRKIYIDSRMGQGTGSDFTVTLKQSVQVPENTVAYIDECIVPNTFTTIDANRCFIYLREQNGAAVTDRRAQIAYGNYAGVDLATAVQAALQVNTALSGSYTVTFNANKANLKITFSGTGTFLLGTRTALLTAGQWGGRNFGHNPQDANDVIGLSKDATTSSDSIEFNHMVQLMQFQNVHLTSSSFGNLNQSQGTNGETDIIRRVPIDQPWGNLIHSVHSTTCDWVDVSGHQLDTMSFQLRDPYGRLCDMKGLHISFAICLIAKDIV